MTDYKKCFKRFSSDMLISILKNDFDVFGGDTSVIKKSYPKELSDEIIAKRRDILDILLGRSI